MELLHTLSKTFVTLQNWQKIRSQIINVTENVMFTFGGIPLGRDKK